MSDELTVDMKEVIQLTYEQMGFAVLDVRQGPLPSAWYVDIIHPQGPETVMVSMLLVMQKCPS